MIVKATNIKLFCSPAPRRSFCLSIRSSSSVNGSDLFLLFPWPCSFKSVSVYSLLHLLNDEMQGQRSISPSYSCSIRCLRMLPCIDRIESGSYSSPLDFRMLRNRRANNKFSSLGGISYISLSSPLLCNHSTTRWTFDYVFFLVDSIFLSLLNQHILGCLIRHSGECLVKCSSNSTKNCIL